MRGRLLPAVAALVFAFGAAAQPPGSTEPSEPRAGTWRTWVLTSGSQFRLPPPPDQDVTRGEIGQLRALAADRSPAARERIAWWETVAPAYRWNQVMLEEAINAGLPANLGWRNLAVLQTALADAMVAAWDSKHAYNRPRPATVEPGLEVVGTTPPSPSYPEEHAVAAAVAAEVLTYVFPQRAARFAQMADEAARMRLLAGVAFPSDVAAGAALGRQVAAAAIERARRDRSDQPWTGSIPPGPGLWNGTNPVFPQAATWTTWILASPDEFRPPPPPAHDSAEHAAEMAALRAYQRTPRSNAAAMYWEVAVGGLRNYEYWNNQAARLLLEYGQAANAPQAARVLGLLNASLADAGIACWDAKYTYWRIRPFQFDSEFRTVVPTPNHPSYPAAHACYSMTAALLLADLFPRDAERLQALGRESGDSRIWAGIHYPSDVAAGQALAARVAARAIERARADVAPVQRQ
ncbi:phosphatase PAP2 family protein [Falsiroseomonas sp. HW251]|uniref:phosphatase PAP2 family protein n=1 Tax=Falsiroseomonas sp. HW251 TaxID=3390998 RepID=UPI003D31FFB5